jgi:hypothetical protein
MIINVLRSIVREHGRFFEVPSDLLPRKPGSRLHTQNVEEPYFLTIKPIIERTTDVSAMIKLISAL